MGDSAEVAQITAPPKHSWSSYWPSREGLVLLLLLGWLYHSALYQLVHQWVTDDDAGYGFVVPCFAAFVVWQNRARLRRIPIAPSWAGVPLVVLSLALFIVAHLGVELFTERVSLVLLLAGLILSLCGWEMFRALLFPWAILFLMIPLPRIISQQFAFPLQLLASKLAAGCLEAARIPVNREGNILNLATIRLDVVEACSGLRSLVTLIALAIIYGYLMETRNRVRIALVCVAVPIAIAANAFRIFATGVLAVLWDPTKAQGLVHEIQGELVFVVSLILLFTVHAVINRIWKEPLARNLPPNRDVHSDDAHADVRSRETSPRIAWSAQFVASVALMVATATFLQAHSQAEVVPPRQPLASLPMQFGSWSGVDDPLDEETLEVLGHPEYVSRYYTKSQDPWVNLLVLYYPTQRKGETPHTPLHCMVGAGFTPARREVVQLTGPNGTFGVNRWVAVKGDERQLVLYWFQAHGREVASEYKNKYYLVADSIRLHRSDGSLIRFETPMSKDESADAAQARTMEVINQTLPLLDNSIPR